MPKKKGPLPWGYVFYEERGQAPAYEWLKRLPDNIRHEFLNTIESVLLSASPPTQYLPNRWHAMKKVRTIDMGGYHEARDQHASTNYRLYCHFDRGAAEVEELGSPVLVLLDGASKPEGEEMPESVYLHVQRLWERYFQAERRCSEVEFPPVDDTYMLRSGTGGAEMAAMKTVTRPRRLEDLRGPETASQRRDRQLKVQALSATGALLGVFNEQREQKDVSKAELARQMDTERTVISRLLSDAGEANPTIETIIKLLWGLGLRAEITVFDRNPGENRLLEVNDERRSAATS